MLHTDRNRGSQHPQPGTELQPERREILFQGLEDKTGKASDGTVLTCTKGDDGKDRWTASTDSAGADKASAGKFCAKDLEGKTGKASDGTVLTCTKGDDGKDRWVKK
ncbi:Uncharacterised protein [Mycobacteroides abscessus]|nr:Uncharacterised protein [Mycobacteroides abscessus]